jgi:putative nucleotidyltransferase with HDIG domain
MAAELPSREEALALLHEYTASDSLRKHALAVEAALRAYARRYGEDEERWGLTGLLHDFDYERWPTPEDHPRRGVEILAEKGYPEDIRRAILGHAPYTGVPRDTLLAKALMACDELCGFLTACALVRPDRRVGAVKVSSVRKKLKSPAFARSVSREDIALGIEELEVPFEEHVAFVRDAMASIGGELGLAGDE